MSGCTLCPRACRVDRGAGQRGVCGERDTVRAARAALHFWEEPCISGEGGSGAVFFSGCALRCVYCQNAAISRGGVGAEISSQRLREIFFSLIEQGAENINLVTPSHFAPQIAEALQGGLPVPVVYNCAGYETVETLRRLDGLVDVYLPDFKYADPALAAAYSNAADYPAVAVAALKEMYRQTGAQVFDSRGMLIKGVQVRHLVLPGHLENTYGVIDAFSALFPHGEAGFSLMSQFTPTDACKHFPALCRRLTQEEYERAVDYMYLCGIENGFVQELSSAKEEYTPPFDLTGL
ncbi:MAG: 4Fe-4S cluster-binding domain-containing protein [Clostridia bacterium]|nr:4Fe-4S cluster-binding domain-containing protein [Clostridia bacterium]